MSSRGIRSEEGWEAFVTGMRQAFEASPDDLMLVGAVLAVGVIAWANWKIARHVQRVVHRPR